MDSRDPLACLLEVVASVFRERGEWPSRQYVQAVLDQDFYVDLDEASSLASSDLLIESGSQPKDKIRLTVRGLHEAGAKAEVERYVEVLRWCVDEAMGFRPSDPGQSEEVQVSSEQLRAEWELRGRSDSDLDLAKLYELIRMEGIFTSLHEEGGSWSMDLSYDRLRKFRGVRTIEDYLEAIETPSTLTRPPHLVPIPLAAPQPDAPVLTRLDARVKEASAPLFESGHFAPAVHEATKAMRDLIREASGLSDDGDTLVAKAFRVTDPKLPLFDLNSETGRSAQRGVMLLAQGIFAAIRNPLAHDRGALTQNQAEEMLSIVNFVVRTIHERPEAGRSGSDGTRTRDLRRDRPAL
jgi:uncharacterized protein (TIGR02391 family)